MDTNKRPTIKHYQDGTASVLRKAVVYTELRFYQRSDVLYQLTQVFCQRFLPRYGDRTVSQTDCLIIGDVLEQIVSSQKKLVCSRQCCHKSLCMFWH